MDQFLFETLISLVSRDNFSDHFFIFFTGAWYLNVGISFFYSTNFPRKLYVLITPRSLYPSLPFIYPSHNLPHIPSCLPLSISILQSQINQTHLKQRSFYLSKLNPQSIFLILTNVSDISMSKGFLPSVFYLFCSLCWNYTFVPHVWLGKLIHLQVWESLCHEALPAWPSKTNHCLLTLKEMSRIVHAALNCEREGKAQGKALR